MVKLTIFSDLVICVAHIVDKKWGPRPIPCSWPPLSCKGRKLTEENVIPNKALSLRLLVARSRPRASAKRKK
ncbi:MAG: hypothetical protein CMF70_04085 [Magnetovibrio sp.]|nr:hypothetical protein [Magnetovibrio sp.]